MQRVCWSVSPQPHPMIREIPKQVGVILCEISSVDGENAALCPPSYSPSYRHTSTPPPPPPHTPTPTRPAIPIQLPTDRPRPGCNRQIDSYIRNLRGSSDLNGSS